MSANGTDIRSKEYSAWKTRFYLLDLGLTFVYLVLFQIYISKGLSAAVPKITQNFYAGCLIYLSLFMAGMYLFTFPLHFISSFLLEKRFNLSRQNIFTWFYDEMKSFLLSYVFFVFCGEMFYFILRNFPSSWWVVASIGWLFFSVILTKVLPVILIPVFYKYSSITDPSLKERIQAVSRKAKVELLDVCQIDLSRKTKKANAALVGLGSSRRVVLADNLVNEFSVDEVGAVVAHEFGHFVNRHIWKLLAFMITGTTIGFYLFSLIAGKLVEVTGASGISDLSIFPFLVILSILSGICMMPAGNFFSRCLEREADEFSLKNIENPGSFISMMKKLGEKNLADTDPSRIKKFFLYDHPPISERIRSAEEHIRNAGS